jgi:lipid A 3-O-deacylase
LSPRAALACALAGLGAASMLAAAPASAQPRGLEVRVDNDSFVTPRADDERWYTSGVFVRAAFDAPADAPDARLAAAWCARVVGCDPGSATLRLVSLSHRIHTPGLTGTAGPQPYDRPYAAALALGAASVVVGERTRQGLELQLGAVGPAALGEPVQNALHALLGQPPARGWPWQVRPQALAQLGWSRVSSHRLGVTGADVVLRTGVLLGTPQTQAEAGAMLRVGGAGPAWPGESLGVREPAGWQLFAGVEGRAVARDTLIDGATFGHASQVRREPLVGSAFAGVSFGALRDWRLELAVAVHGVAFDSPVQAYPFRPQRVGTIGLRWQPR